MTTGSLYLSLELHSNGERIAGQLRDQHGNGWPFSSWLGLLALIERLRLGPPPLTGQPGQPQVSELVCRSRDAARGFS